MSFHPPQNAPITLDDIKKAMVRVREMDSWPCGSEQRPHIASQKHPDGPCMNCGWRRASS